MGDKPASADPLPWWMILIVSGVVAMAGAVIARLFHTTRPFFAEGDVPFVLLTSVVAALGAPLIDALARRLWPFARRPFARQAVGVTLWLCLYPVVFAVFSPVIPLSYVVLLLLVPGHLIAVPLAPLILLVASRVYSGPRPARR
ncbi:hypothetical protein GCM10027079_03860 [Sediminivirga luteola]|uniref:Uncharacterized protein n=1 Tax=Sediminivirga luteola TaxID=1774748 RepID=A0A8J2XKH4_9MICO|nr:hypothetical protein GCM10011333_10800 [Sediminivirga luteola]